MEKVILKIICYIIMLHIAQGLIFYSICYIIMLHIAQGLIFNSSRFILICPGFSRENPEFPEPSRTFPIKFGMVLIGSDDTF